MDRQRDDPASTRTSSTGISRGRSTSWPICCSTRSSPPTTLARERQVVLEEIKMYDDSPGRSCTIVSGARSGAGEPGRSDDRLRAYVLRIGRDESAAWRATRYAPATVFLTAGRQPGS